MRTFMENSELSQMICPMFSGLRGKNRPLSPYVNSCPVGSPAPANSALRGRARGCGVGRGGPGGKGSLGTLERSCKKINLLNLK